MLHKCSTRIMPYGLLLDVANKNLVFMAKIIDGKVEILECRTTLTEAELDNEKPKADAPDPTDPDGPGSILAVWLARVGIEATGSCGCSATQKLMDRQGPDWCEKHIVRVCLLIEMSLEDLKDEANDNGELALKLKLYNRKAAKLAIRAACKESRSRFGA